MKTKLFALILIIALVLPLSGCASAQVKASLASLESGADVLEQSSDPKEGVDPELYRALWDNYQLHLRELRKEVGP